MMNKSPATPTPEEGRCKNNCCRSNSFWRIVLKIFLGVAVFLLVFSLGAACVVKMKYVRFSPGMGYGESRFGMMKPAFLKHDNQGREFSKTSVQNWQRVFGVIIKIEGNKIALTNNAAEEIVVLSRAETIIILNATEVGLNALKTGQNVVVVYAPGEDGQNNAKTISVQ